MTRDELPHISRGWEGDPFAPVCGCDRLPCGFVGGLDPLCDQHNGSRTIRSSHPADECPGEE